MSESQDGREPPRNICCCCCCDMRKAAIVCDILLMIWSFVAWLPHLIWVLQNDDDNIDIDTVNLFNFMHEFMVVFAIVNGVSILAYTLPMYGAYVHEVPHLIIGVLWFCGSFIANVVICIVYVYVHAPENTELPLSIWYFFLAVLLSWIVLCIYVHVALILTIRRGGYKESIKNKALSRNPNEDDYVNNYNETELQA